MHKTSAWPLSQAYVALIVYASLYPFSGWHDQGVNPLEFLWSPLPRYWTGFDVTANALGYGPLGFLLALSFLRRGSIGPVPTTRTRAITVATLAAAVLSLSMEVLQNYLPSRVSSNVDFGLNVLGALVGRGSGRRAGTGRRHRPLEPLSGALVRRGRQRRPGAAGAVAFRAAVPAGGAARPGPGLRAAGVRAGRVAAGHALPGMAAGARHRVAAAGAGRRTDLRGPGPVDPLPAGLLDHPPDGAPGGVCVGDAGRRNRRDGPVGCAQLGALARLGLAQPAGMAGPGCGPGAGRWCRWPCPGAAAPRCCCWH